MPEEIDKTNGLGYLRQRKWHFNIFNYLKKEESTLNF